MTQCEQLLDLFRTHNGKLLRGEIMRTNLAAEYRARMTDLRGKGYKIELLERHPEMPSQNLYQLTEPVYFEGNQAVFA